MSASELLIARLALIWLWTSMISGGVQTAYAQPLPQDGISKPNIVLAIADDWGWPHAGALGDQAVQTPTFDRLARGGVLFPRAFVSSPSCTPSRGAIITGQHFWRLGSAANLWSQWPHEQFPEFPRLLEQAGYHIGHFRKAWGPGRSQRQPAGTRYESVDAFFAARPPGKPFCLWFGSSDPHRGYQAGSGAAAGIPLDQVHLFSFFPNTQEVRSDIADYYWEVQRFDRQVGQLVQRIREMGQWNNTLFVMTSDHGMPFPRCKTNLYDSGARVPLVIAGGGIPGDRVITDFVSLTDLAPTFVEAAGVEIPESMTGRSLLSLLRSSESGRVEAIRNHVLIGRERHVIAQEQPQRGGYPMRAIRTERYLYIRNFRPDRWPAGTPDYQQATYQNAWLADCDNGPTKMAIWNNRNRAGYKSFYQWCFGQRPAEELYDVEQDPDQINNLAADEQYASVRNELWQRLNNQLTRFADPRVVGEGDRFDEYPYFGGAPQWPDK